MGPKESKSLNGPSQLSLPGFRGNPKHKERVHLIILFIIYIFNILIRVNNNNKKSIDSWRILTNPEEKDRAAK